MNNPAQTAALALFKAIESGHVELKPETMAQFYDENKHLLHIAVHDPRRANGQLLVPVLSYLCKCGKEEKTWLLRHTPAIPMGEYVHLCPESECVVCASLLC